MPIRALELPGDGLGHIWLSAMPARVEPWADFLQQVADRQIDEVVCLNPLYEVQRLSPAYAAAVAAGELPFRWTHVPMQDFGLAMQIDTYRAAIDGMAETVQRGGSLLLHCAAGIGRTGTTAACLLKRLGTTQAVALQRVRDAGSNPESAVQQGLIDRF
jgi:protein tyrosine phosphatase